MKIKKNTINALQFGVGYGEMDELINFLKTVNLIPFGVDGSMIIPDNVNAICDSMEVFVMKSNFDVILVLDNFDKIPANAQKVIENFSETIISTYKTVSVAYVYSKPVEEKKPINYNEAIEKFIIGQKVTGFFSKPAYATNDPADEKYYGEGFQYENGFKTISFGGGCSGEDCNTSWVVGPDNKIVASISW